MAKKNSAKRKAKKAKQRSERIRQEKHARKSIGTAPGEMPQFPDLFGPWSDMGGDDADWENEDDEVEDGDDSWDLEDYTSERVLRTMAWETSRRIFADQAELSRFVANELTDESWRIHHGTMLVASSQERAQELAFQARESDADDAREELAEQALAIDPDCLEAASVLANAKVSPELNQQLEDVLERYCQRPAVAAALAIQDGRAWSRVEARPVIRALMVLIVLAIYRKNLVGELRWLDQLRSLDLAHHQDFRHRHVAALLMSLRLEDARAMLVRPRDTPDITWYWGSILERFLTGDLVGARILVEEARQWLFMDGEELLLRGDRAEYSDVRLLKDLDKAWAFHPAAMSWLRADCRLTTPEQSQAAKQSYLPPVARLLSLGMPQQYQAGLTEALKSIPLSEADIPELLRLADDQALHELPGEDPACFGPVYAFKALADLATPSTLPSLLGLLPRRVHDEWIAPSLQDALAQIGPTVLRPLAELMDDPGQEPRTREFVVQALETLVKKHPETREAVVGVIFRRLRNFSDQSYELNGALASALAWLGARESHDVVAEAYAAQAIDGRMFGDFDDWQKQLAKAVKKWR